MGFQIVVVAILIFVVVTVWKGVRIVPQGEEWIVQRLGQFSAVLYPGLLIIIPYIDQVPYKVVTKGHHPRRAPAGRGSPKDSRVNHYPTPIAFHRGNRPRLRGVYGGG